MCCTFGTPNVEVLRPDGRRQRSRRLKFTTYAMARRRRGGECRLLLCCTLVAPGTLRPARMSLSWSLLGVTTSVPRFEMTLMTHCDTSFRRLAAPQNYRWTPFLELPNPAVIAPGASHSSGPLGEANATTRFHQSNYRISRCLAARGARAAIQPGTTDWSTDEFSRERSRRSGALSGIHPSTNETRLDRRQQSAHRYPLGRGRSQSRSAIRR